jgi:hypothetical protein
VAAAAVAARAKVARGVAMEVASSAAAAREAAARAQQPPGQ